jgi:hypothetical protein
LDPKVVERLRVESTELVDVPVDAENALSTNHTASRKAGFARAERE